MVNKLIKQNEKYRDWVEDAPVLAKLSISQLNGFT